MRALGDAPSAPEKLCSTLNWAEAPVETAARKTRREILTIPSTVDLLYATSFIRKENETIPISKSGPPTRRRNLFTTELRTRMTEMGLLHSSYRLSTNTVPVPKRPP